MKVAIVGSEEKYWHEATLQKMKKIIREIINRHSKDVNDFDDLIIISGHSHKGGVDIEVEKIVKDYPDIDLVIYPPKILSWAGEGGYKSRNITIAKECNIIYTIDPRERDHSGGIWTARFAERIGKDAHFIKV